MYKVNFYGVWKYRKYLSIINFSDDLISVETYNDKWGFVDKKGNEVIACQYSDVDSLNEGLALVAKEGKYGYIDKTGKEVIPCQYSDAYAFSEGLAVVAKEGKYGYVDKAGKEVIPCQYSDAYAFSEGLALVAKEGKYGYIDKEGNIVIPIQYSDADSFSEGLAVVRKEGKYGYIDKEGNVVIPIQYYEAESFSGGLAEVYNKGYRYIDKNDCEVNWKDRACENKKESKLEIGHPAIEETLKKKLENAVIYAGLLKINDESIEIEADTEEEVYLKAEKILDQVKKNFELNAQEMFAAVKTLKAKNAKKDNK